MCCPLHVRIPQCKNIQGSKSSKNYTRIIYNLESMTNQTLYHHSGDFHMLSICYHASQFPSAPHQDPSICNRCVLPKGDVEDVTAEKVPCAHLSHFVSLCKVPIDTLKMFHQHNLETKTQKIIIPQKRLKYHSSGHRIHMDTPRA